MRSVTTLVYLNLQKKRLTKFDNDDDSDGDGDVFFVIFFGVNF